MNRSSKLIRFLPIVFILSLMLVAYLFDIGKYLMFDELRQRHQMLQLFVAEYPIAAPLLFVTAYIIVTALSLPGASLLSITGGFLFPQPFSLLYVVCGATVGATCIFLAAKTALGNYFKEKIGNALYKMQNGFEENAVSYLLFLRLVPLFPFWLVNIAAAFFNVPLKTFAATTFVGIIPGAFVFTQAGAGLGSILETQGELTLNAIFTTDIKIALIALAFFALIPVVIKKIRKHHKDPRP